MGILIDSIRVAGFRGIQNLEVSLPRVAVLIGPNNSGKTTLLKSLQLALGDYSRYLSEEDFYISADEKRVSEIVVDIRIISVDTEGKRQKTFEPEWQTEFTDGIQAEATGNQFLAVRTRAKQNPTKGGFDVTRTSLDMWPAFSAWRSTKLKEARLPARFSNMPFICMEAQRDIHQDLRDKYSFIGRILSGIEYDKTDVATLESLIKEINDQAVAKSADLLSLKAHLEKLRQSIGGSGGAEVTPFPKKLRDLSKNFSVHFGESDKNSFSMEYHGMGTRSWASMLTTKSFIDITRERHKSESQPFFSILAAEEPEAHLHPNAQRTLYQQLADIEGQLFLSTHSPYFASMAELHQIRSLVRTSAGVAVFSFGYELTDEDRNILKREVLAKRGELLFAKALLLCEGVTEEQVLPKMFEIHAKETLWNLGISCISVGGKYYSPYVRMSGSFGIPACILSDNDGQTATEIAAQVRRITKETNLQLPAGTFGVHYLQSGNDFEAELIAHGMRDEIVDALVLCLTNGSQNSRYRQAKYKVINALNDADLLSTIRSAKASYAGFLADILHKNTRGKTKSQLVPPSVAACFDQITGWL